jgi:hypothetical protein
MVLGNINKVAFLHTHRDMAISTRADFAHQYLSDIVDFIKVTFNDSEATPQLTHGIEVIYQLLFVPKLMVPGVLITSKLFHKHYLALLSTSPNIRADAAKDREWITNIKFLALFNGDKALFSISNIFPKTSSTQEQEQRVPTIGLCYPYCESGYHCCYLRMYCPGRSSSLEK